MQKMNNLLSLFTPQHKLDLDCGRVRNPQDQPRIDFEEDRPEIKINT